jgi:hypothetical protein
MGMYLQQGRWAASAVTVVPRVWPVTCGHKYISVVTVTLINNDYGMINHFKTNTCSKSRRQLISYHVFFIIG